VTASCHQVAPQRKEAVSSRRWPHEILVPGTRRTAEPAITGDPVTYTLKAGQLFGIDVGHVAGPCPLITAKRLDGLQVHEWAKPYGVDHHAIGGERPRQHPCQSSEPAPLMGELIGAFQLKWIERPPMSATNTSSIHSAAAPPER
jgi:hypothetical protein